MQSIKSIEFKRDVITTLRNFENSYPLTFSTIKEEAYNFFYTRALYYIKHSKIDPFCVALSIKTIRESIKTIKK